MDATIMIEVGLGIALFTAIVLVLVLVILAARSRLVSRGNVSILVNDDKELKMPVGIKLMQGLADADLFVASACGGGGTCGLSLIHISEPTRLQ